MARLPVTEEALIEQYGPHLNETPAGGWGTAAEADKRLDGLLQRLIADGELSTKVGKTYTLYAPSGIAAKNSLSRASDGLSSRHSQANSGLLASIRMMASLRGRRRCGHASQQIPERPEAWSKNREKKSSLHHATPNL